MADEPQILYLEPDDEITSVIRRLREADASRVVLVAPGRTKAASSALALRLLAGVAADEGRELALVADGLGRSLAAEAGIAAFGSIAEASGAASAAAPAAPAQRATIHVVRSELPLEPRATMASDETRPVAVVRSSAAVAPPPARRRRAAAGPGDPRRRWLLLALLAALLLSAGVAAAAVLPSATIRITPRTVAVGPTSYEVAPPVQQVSGTIPLTLSAKATGDHVELVAATGSVTFSNWNTVPVEVPAGSQVAAGEIVFVTAESIVVPSGQFTTAGTVQAGEASVAVAAVKPGPTGNVATNAIDTVVDRRLRGSLRGFPNSRLRVVANPQATTGGAAKHQPEVLQADVDALTRQLTDQLLTQLATALASHPDLLIVTPSPAEKPAITIPAGLVGTRGKPTFALSGSLAYDRLAVRSADVAAAARQRLLADPAQAPRGTSIAPDSIKVGVTKARAVGDAVSVAVAVSGEAVPTVDQAAIRGRVAGLTPGEARTALADLGAVEVTLWPGWVSRVPGLSWRVGIEVNPAEPLPRASASP